LIRRVLMVCVGNICRSPAAEVLLRQALPTLTVESAGLGTVDGCPADDHVVALLAERGLEAGAHRSRQLAQWMVTSADVVLVMEASHKRQLEQQFPQVRGRVFRLLEAQKADIPDPYRQPREVFEAALVQIEQGVADWTRKIRAIGHA